MIWHSVKKLQLKLFVYDKYNKNIRYTLKINEDDTKGTLNLNDLKWFEK